MGGEVDPTDIGEDDQATEEYNGVALNGVALNGVALNGVALNGVALNGVALNGVALNGTALSGTTAAGTLYTAGHFAGATFQATLVNGSTKTIRIDSVSQDADPEIWLYGLSMYNSAYSRWDRLCYNSATYAHEPAIPVAGRWLSNGSKDSTAGHFTFACRHIGAIAKCVDFGYKPWETCVDATRAANVGTGYGCNLYPTLNEYHQACVRMVRADYCGDGVANTTNGRVLNILDRSLLNKDNRSSYPGYHWWFEAFWSPNGAMCVSGDLLQSGYTYRKIPSCVNQLTKCTNVSTNPSVVVYGIPPSYVTADYGAF